MSPPGSGASPPPPRRSSLGSGLPFLVPFAVVAVLFLIVPILYGLWLSFTEQSSLDRKSVV